MKNKITFNKLSLLMKLDNVTIRLCDQCNTFFEMLKSEKKSHEIDDKILCISCYKKYNRQRNKRIKYNHDIIS